MGVCVLSRPQVKEYDIPNEEYPFEKGNSHSIDLVLKNSKFLNHRYKGDNDPLRKVDQKNRELLQEAEKRLQGEKSTIKENLKLRIKLYDIEDHTTSRVKYIDLVSGKRENDIECHRQGDGSISWKYKKVGSRADQDEEYTFDEINVSKISQILNESKFLGAQCHRDSVGRDVREKMGKAWFDQKNCKLYYRVRKQGR
ncbi:uncharacterized protein LOC110459024 [Mizuhopecten yessoensis]|uniref:uncharacterized protein LOC110459024 n=1 Tax=Mizuhopecten yessoensis TaxID=6573 RepID=UPI000B45E5C0|nr:uncharacterized protein LOC110459024 [Mizuhopecten yessoensis]